MQSPFNIWEVDLQHNRITVDLRADFVQSLSRVLIDTIGNNAAFFALAAKLQTCTNIIQGETTIKDHPELGDVDIVSENTRVSDMILVA